ncbi:hypothetical protein ACWD4G_12985 [Streptomyces sp. NPDC002643]
MRGARRGLLGVVGAFAVAVGVSGCSPEELALAAVTVGEDGVPRALLRPCGDDGYLGPTLTGWKGSDEDEPGDGEPDATVWKAKGERSGDAEFPLFSPPGEWDVEREGEQRLVSTHTYRLGFGHYDDRHYNGSVVFTVADLEGLAPGRVWADGRGMSLGEFEGLAEGAC